MDPLGWALIAVTALFVVSLLVIEGLALLWGKPTISDRVRGIRTSAPFVVVLALVLIGVLLDHAWGGA